MSTQTWTVAEAKAKLSELLEKAKLEGPQKITKHGRTTARDSRPAPTAHAVVSHGDLTTGASTARRRKLYVRPKRSGHSIEKLIKRKRRTELRDCSHVSGFNLVLLRAEHNRDTQARISIMSFANASTSCSSSSLCPAMLATNDS